MGLDAEENNRPAVNTSSGRGADQRIRELEQTKARLATINRHLQAVLDASSEFAIIACDADGLITIFNRGAELMLGFSAGEMVGIQTPLQIHVPSEVVQRSQELTLELGRSISGFRTFVEPACLGGSEQREWTFVRKDGSHVPVSLTITVIHDEQQEVTGFLGIAEDITERKRAEQLLRQKEELLSTIIESIPNPIFYKNAEGKYTGCNQAFCDYLGFPRERIIGATVYDVAPKKLAEVYHQADLDLIRSGGSQVYETAVRYADGTEHEVILYKSAMTGGDRSLSGLVGVMLDITKQKQAVKELRQKEELFHLLFEKSGDANLLIDGTAIIDCNEATVRLLGYPDKHHLIGRHPGEISPEFQPDGRYSQEKGNELMLRAYEEGSLRFEWLHLRMDGATLPVEVMLTAIPMHGRWLLHTAWRDLTERKRAEEEREKLAQNLLHAQKIESIGRLAGGVAHDFNNLLTPILGYAEMLKKSPGINEAGIKRINGILDAAGKARDLTRQLLAFGRKQVLEMRVLDLNETISAFTSILERTIREDIHISLRLAPGLASITADSSQLEQIIMNLAINAQDAMPGGGTLLIQTDNTVLDATSLAAAELPPGLYVKLEVSDTGLGMDRDTLSQIFEPFFTTKDQLNGTGLGLATVFGIVKQHGGHINVYSEPGLGSRFAIYFPAVGELATGYTATEESSPPEVHMNATILLVEDNEMVREMCYELLSDSGYRVLAAEDPGQAKSIMELHGEGIDLLLSDVIMPGLSGPVLFEQLQARKPSLKVLFMSGYNENTIAPRSMLGGSPNFIQKPFSAQAILNKVYEILKQPAQGTP